MEQLTLDLDLEEREYRITLEVDNKVVPIPPGLERPYASHADALMFTFKVLDLLQEIGLCLTVDRTANGWVAIQKNSVGPPTVWRGSVSSHFRSTGEPPRV